MSSLLSDIVTRVQTLLGTDPQLSNAEIQTMAITRYEHLYNTNPWSRRKQEFLINLVGKVSSAGASVDGVTVTTGSATVTSVGTPFTAAMVGRQMHIGVEPQYFYINSFNSSSSIVLGDGHGNAATWPRATAANVSWDVFQTIYGVPSDLDVMMSLGSNYPLREMDGGRDQLDRLDPQRSSSTSDPTHWMYAGEDTNGVRLLELWPVPTISKVLRGQYLNEAPTITPSTRIAISVAAFTYALAADCYNMLHSKTGDEAYKNLAVFYEQKTTQVLRDVIPYEVSRLSPPQSIHRRRSAFGRGTDWEVSHDLDLLERIP
jgi:hypothetical protein